MALLITTDQHDNPGNTARVKEQTPLPSLDAQAH